MLVNLRVISNAGRSPLNVKIAPKQKERTAARRRGHHVEQIFEIRTLLVNDISTKTSRRGEVNVQKTRYFCNDSLHPFSNLETKEKPSM